MLISEAFAQAGGGTTDMLTSLLPLVLIFVVFYFLLIRPQQKKMKEHKAMIEAVRRGDGVTTSGGIIGKIAKVQADGVIPLETADGVTVKGVKGTILAIRKRDGKG